MQLHHRGLRTKYKSKFCRSSRNASVVAAHTDGRDQYAASTCSRRLVNLSLALGVCVPFVASATAAIVEEDVSESVFEKGAPCIVTIRRKGGGMLGDPKNLGTGVVWDSFGHIATNYHVVARVIADKRASQALEVVAWDRQQQRLWAADASVRASDAFRDLAVLEVDSLEGSPLSAVVAGPSSSLKVGQYVYCFGAPQPDNPTLSVGVLSGLNRSFPSASGNRIYGALQVCTFTPAFGNRIYGALQVDAVINRDNSGGPVLDSFGRMVGLATATYSTYTTSDRGSGINFALPMDSVRELVPRLIIYGNASGKN